MARVVAFLRAIKVGGHTVTMEKLRGIFEDLGFKNVETFIASGNVIFPTTVKNLEPLERKIEARLEKSLGYEVKTFLRTEAEVSAIAKYLPFKDSQMKAAGALNVAFLGEDLDRDKIKTLMTLKTSIDDFQVHQREVYWLCKKKQSESEFSNALFEKTLKVRATFRGINTLRKLAVKLGF